MWPVLLLLSAARANTCYHDTCQPRAYMVKDAGDASTIAVSAAGFEAAGLEVKITTLAR